MQIVDRNIVQPGQAANLSTPIWCSPVNLKPNLNEAELSVHRTDVRIRDFDLTEFLLPKDIDDKQADCSDIDLDFFN